ncbi:RING finger protein 148 isoform X1 [Danio rerio]|uniref:RING finger protein 148 isoform X1 n=1 Tax=Danio rerio TaxID=7955 RepID=A0A8M9Q025_DANRE
MKSKLGFRATGEHGRSCIWLTVLTFQCCFQLSAAAATFFYWTADVGLSYFDRESNETVISMCECGKFGINSPLRSASGLAVLPNSDPLACSKNTTFTASHQPWIALIKTGKCSYTKKINSAQREGASAVVIYNEDGTGNDVILMMYSGADDLVAINIGNILGTQIAYLINNGLDVNMTINVATPTGVWKGTWAYVLSFTFIGITAVTMFYFAFLFMKRMYINRQLRRQQMEIKRETEKAIGKLEVRTLRTNDPEVDSDDTGCVVCTDSYQRGEQVTVLPCRHLYHKKCIEPWLLEHPTCPMCKYNILKSSIEEDSYDQPSPSSSSSSSSSSNDTFCLATITSADQRSTLQSNIQTEETAAGHTSDTVNCNLDIHTQHIYDNPGFEEEPEIIEHQNINQQL